MRALVIVLLCAVMLEAAVYKTDLRSTGSLRRFIKSGRYARFLRNKASGSIPLSDYFGDIYLCNITMGTPPQQFVVMPNTASSDLWIVSTECTTNACKGFADSGYVKHRFNASASSTFHKIGDSFELNADSSGYTADDVLSFGGLTVQAQMFGMVTSADSFFGYFPIDGTMGLGWPDLAIFSTSTVMQNLISQLDLPLFTIWLDRNRSDKSDGGQITFGGYDSDHCDTAINWVPLTSKTYWQFHMDGVAIGSFKTKLNTEAFMATGFVWVGGPSPIMEKIVSEAGGLMDENLQEYLIPCKAMTTAPDLIFNINNVDYPITATQYIRDVNLGGGMCEMMFFNRETGGFAPQWLFGHMFIRAYCNMFNFGDASIGFSRAKATQI